MIPFYVKHKKDGGEFKVLAMVDYTILLADLKTMRLFKVHPTSLCENFNYLPVEAVTRPK